MTRVVSLFLPTLSTDRVRRKSGGAAPPGEAPLVLVGRVDGLRVLGFDRVADLLGQPRAPLALRFGPELGRRIDQAIGRLSEPIETIRPAALSSSGLRRTDRRRGYYCALYRQARESALRRA